MKLLIGPRHGEKIVHVYIILDPNLPKSINQIENKNVYKTILRIIGWANEKNR
jgi:hypothetical protein